MPLIGLIRSEATSKIIHTAFLPNADSAKDLNSAASSFEAVDAVCAVVCLTNQWGSRKSFFELLSPMQLQESGSLLAAIHDTRISASFVRPMVEFCHGCASTRLGFTQLNTRFDSVNIHCCPPVLPELDTTNSSRFNQSPRVHAYTFGLDAAILRTVTGVRGF